MSDLEFCDCPVPHPVNEATRRSTEDSLTWARLIGDHESIKRLAAMLSGPCPQSATRSASTGRTARRTAKTSQEKK